MFVLSQQHLDSNEAKEPLVVKLPGIISKKKGDLIFLTAAVEKIHLFNREGISLNYL